MVELQNAVDELKEADTILVGISYDSVEVLKRFVDNREVTYTLLSDAESEVIKSFGVLNEDSRAAIPHPGTFLIGQDGKVKAKLFTDGYRARHSNQALIEAAQSLKDEQ